MDWCPGLFALDQLTPREAGLGVGVHMVTAERTVAWTAVLLFDVSHRTTEGRTTWKTVWYRMKNTTVDVTAHGR